MLSLHPVLLYPLRFRCFFEKQPSPNSWTPSSSPCCLRGRCGWNSAKSLQSGADETVLWFSQFSQRRGSHASVTVCLRAMVFAHMCLVSTSYTLLSWLPTYFKETFPHAKVLGRRACVEPPEVPALTRLFCRAVCTTWCPGCAPSRWRSAGDTCRMFSSAKVWPSCCFHQDDLLRHMKNQTFLFQDTA